MPQSNNKKVVWGPDRTSLGLLILLMGIHVSSLIGLAWVVHAQFTQQSKQAVVAQVGEVLDGLTASWGLYDPDKLRGIQATLSAFESVATWDGLRLVDRRGEILASLNASEVSTQHWQSAEFASHWPGEFSTEWADSGSVLLEHVTYRAPLMKGINQPEVMLEGVIRPSRLIVSSSFLSGWSGIIVVGSILSFILICAVVRQWLRPLNSIGVNLVKHQHQLSQELSSLRLSYETHAVAKAWNQLVELFEELHIAATQKSAYQELNSALEKRSAVEFIEAADQIPDGFMQICGGHRVRYINATASRLVGLSAAAATSVNSLWDHKTHAAGQRILSAIRSAYVHGHFESKTISVEGESETTYRVRIVPVMNGQHGADALVLISDISQLARAEKSRELFVTHVSHELRTPLTNIQAYVETLSEMNDPTVQAECFNVINKETRRLARMVEEMLSVAQMDLGTIQVRHDDVDLMELLQEAFRDMKANADAKSVKLVEKLPSKLPVLQADRDKLAVVFNNLLGNAVKYTKPNGSVTLSGKFDGDWVRVCIQDTGIGIAPEDQEKIFERMYRVKSDEVQKQVGTGIGLTTAREIARAHGGEVRVESVLGKGSTFIIELPVGVKILTKGAT